MISIDGVLNSNREIRTVFYHDQAHWKTKAKIEEFKALVKQLVDGGESKTFYKFSDGEYYWLINKQEGSVRAGKRDSNISIRDLTPFREGVIQNDYMMCQLLDYHVAWFREYFKRDFDWPVDYVYALLANKWFTKTFNGQIGLIGAMPKMKLIKRLCKNQEYLDYLEFDGFTDYIGMPQRYMCDDLDYAEELMKEQLEKATSKVFLVGIGHAQQALLYRMKKYKNAVYIVVGSGIDAFAGVQDNTRPYMADWTNYQLTDYDYSTIDIWKSNFINKKIV